MDNILFSLVLLLAICLGLLLVLIFISRSRRRTVELDPLTQLKNLLGQGIKFEDDFIETYIKLLRDEGFLALFTQNTDRARQIMNTLLVESQGHKKALEEIILNIK